MGHGAITRLLKDVICHSMSQYTTSIRLAEPTCFRYLLECSSLCSTRKLLRDLETIYCVEANQRIVLSLRTKSAFGDSRAGLHPERTDRPVTSSIGPCISA